MEKAYELRSAHLVISSGECDLCGSEAVGTLDFDSDDKTFFCASCARLEYEETMAKNAGSVAYGC